MENTKKLALDSLLMRQEIVACLGGLKNEVRIIAISWDANIH
jgi:hypothetical protein